MQISRDLLEIAESMIELGEDGKAIDAARLLRTGRALATAARDIAALEGEVARILAAHEPPDSPATVHDFREEQRRRVLRRWPRFGPPRQTPPEGAV